MNQKNHYESAFECFLRSRKIPYFSNRQEHRNQLPNGQTLKNFDFVVSHPNQGHWIVDIKGRRFPGGKNSKNFWKNWTTEDDLTGMLHWESLMGKNFQALFVFAYLITGDRSPLPFDELFVWHKRRYAFVAIGLHPFIAEARLISPRWRTYELPTSRFRALAYPFTDLLLSQGGYQVTQ